ncbi:MAG: hypothetical protein ABFE08_05575 [Armatimonadia bacterium]
MHDLATVDLIRERLDVTYQAAMDALDEAEGDVVKALALLETSSGGGLQRFEEQIKEGVKRGLSGEELTLIRWKLLGQLVSELPVSLDGFAAVAVGILADLITSSTVETEYAAAVSNDGDDSAAANSH